MDASSLRTRGNDVVQPQEGNRCRLHSAMYIQLCPITGNSFASMSTPPYQHCMHGPGLANFKVFTQPHVLTLCHHRECPSSLLQPNTPFFAMMAKKGCFLKSGTCACVPTSPCQAFAKPLTHIAGSLLAACAARCAVGQEGGVCSPAA